MRTPTSLRDKARHWRTLAWIVSGDEAKALLESAERLEADADALERRALFDLPTGGTAAAEPA